MMATKPDLRVGDAERDSTATLLREHYAQGRLSTDELNERLDGAFSATTQGQLAEITHDLPYLQTAPPVRRPPASSPPRSRSRGLRNVVTLLAVAAAVLGVVFIAQHAGSYLPHTVAELFILLLVLRAVAGRPAGRRHREHHAARYGDGRYGSDEDSDRRHHSGRPGHQFHEHHHDHHRGRNGRGYRYRYRYSYEWSDGSAQRHGSERSEQSEQVR
jgi:hypothetical protein